MSNFLVFVAMSGSIVSLLPVAVVKVDAPYSSSFTPLLLRFVVAKPTQMVSTQPTIQDK